jgi:enediyne biosynthesis protein E4
LNLDKNSEDIKALFFDADNDGDADLFVASGGNEFSIGAPELEDRLYLNDGTGNFVRNRQPAFVANKDIKGALAIADFDKDGLTDVFVGGRIKPFNYGMPSNGNIYTNIGEGNFVDATKQIAPQLENIGMITDALWVDIDNDNDVDLLIAGEWMTLEVFENDAGRLKKGYREVCAHKVYRLVE